MTNYKSVPVITLDHASSRLPLDWVAAQGQRHSTLMLRIRGLTVALVQPKEYGGSTVTSTLTSDFTRAVRRAKIDLCLDLASAGGQGIIFVPHEFQTEFSVSIAAQAKGLAHAKNALVYAATNKDADPGLDILSHAGNFISDWEARRERGINHLKKFGLALREHLATTNAPNPK